MKSFLTLVLTLGTFAGPCMAQELPAPLEVPGIPVAKLPAHVAAPAGRVSLFADFKNRGDLGIPLYLVNRSGKPVTFVSYRGQPFLALEYQAQPGKWKPAQVVDKPLCGNDLVLMRLAGEAALLTHGYQPFEGFRAHVRYRLDHGPGLLSNVGEGRVSHDDLSFLLVSRTSSFELLSKIALGEYLPPTQLAELRPLAINRLADAAFDPTKAGAVLKQIAQGKDQKHATIARNALEFIRKQRGE